ncbi:MAG: bacillithiol biosynthesis BshC [Planctomycetes bacterium]|nr:bacillithiol biosynthesis BshC [Planctomycetota bacterium]
MTGPRASEATTGSWDSADWLRSRAEESGAFVATDRWQRARLVEILSEHAPPSASSRARLLADPSCVAVVTGQQPAVGGGPLYTLVKSAHAIAIAQGLSDSGRTAVPVFWCASEDHDAGEADHADIIARDGTVRRFRGDIGDSRRSLRHRPAMPWWPGLIDHCRSHLGPGAGSAFLEGFAPNPDEGMGAWLCRLIAALFARHGLVCVEAHRLRPLWIDAMRSALERWPAEELSTLRQRLLAGGASDAFGELSEPTVFADRADARTRLDRAAAIALASNDPSSLSPGAPLRPILQQIALPAAISVVGPGELAYHSFIAPLYATLGAQPPVLVARCSVVLVPPWIRRAAERWGIDAGDIRADSVAPTVPTDRNDLDDTLARLEEAIANLASTAEAHKDLQPTVDRLGRIAASFRNRVQRSRRRSAALPPFGPLVATLWPRAQPQERVMSLFQAIWQAGPGIADQLVDAAARTPPGGAHALHF